MIVVGLVGVLSLLLLFCVRCFDSSVFLNFKVVACGCFLLAVCLVVWSLEVVLVITVVSCWSLNFECLKLSTEFQFR